MLATIFVVVASDTNYLPESAILQVSFLVHLSVFKSKQTAAQISNITGRMREFSP